jgi:hypothetical protein
VKPSAHLGFTPEEDAAHKASERREIARQFVPDPKPAAPVFDPNAAAMERQRAMNKAREKRK